MAIEDVEAIEHHGGRPDCVKHAGSQQQRWSSWGGRSSWASVVERAVRPERQGVKCGVWAPAKSTRWDVWPSVLSERRGCLPGALGPLDYLLPPTG